MSAVAGREIVLVVLVPGAGLESCWVAVLNLRDAWANRGRAPLADITAAQLRALPVLSKQRRRWPDPHTISVEHRAAYARMARERADVTTSVAEVVLLFAGALVGSTITSFTSNSTPFAIAITIGALAVVIRVRLVPWWNAVASHYDQNGLGPRRR